MALTENKYPAMRSLPDGVRCPWVWFKQWRCVRPVHVGACLIDKEGQDVLVTPNSSKEFQFFNATGSWCCPSSAIPSLWRALKMRVDPSVG